MTRRSSSPRQQPRIAFCSRTPWFGGGGAAASRPSFQPSTPGANRPAMGGGANRPGNGTIANGGNRANIGNGNRTNISNRDLNVDRDVNINGDGGWDNNGWGC